MYVLHPTPVCRLLTGESSSYRKATELIGIVVILREPVLFHMGLVTTRSKVQLAMGAELGAFEGARPDPSRPPCRG